MSANEEDVCPQCDHEKEWRECWNCGGDVFVEHDCGEDVCCCADPEDNVECDICDAEGGWKVCPICAPGDDP